MAQETKLFAEFTWDNYRNDGDVPQKHEVHDIDAAVRYGNSRSASFFTTHEVTTVDINGKKFTGEPENHSKKNYLCVEKLYTPADVIANLQGATQAPEMAALLKKLNRNGMASLGQQLSQAMSQPHPQIAECAKDTADARYIRLPYSGFVKLQQDEKAYDRAGQEVWPAAQPALPAPAPKPHLPKPPPGKFKIS